MSNKFTGQQKFTSAENGSGGGGNTPRTGEIYSKFESSFCVDYFTFSFPFDYTFPMESFYTVCESDVKAVLYEYLSVLRLNLHNGESSSGTKGFLYGYKWDVPVEYVGEKHSSTRFDYYLRMNDLKIGCFELSGSCCRDFERRCLQKNADVDDEWKNLFDLVLVKNGSCSRIDIAFDFYNVPIEDPFMYFYNKIMNCEFNSPIQTFQPRLKFKDAGDARTFQAQIFELGEIDGDVSGCMYNKKLERWVQKKEVTCANWTRFEMRFRNDAADNLLAGMLENWDRKDKYLIGILRRYFDFRSRPASNEDIFVRRSTRKKWKTDPVWEEMVGSIAKQKLINQIQRESTIQTKAVYLTNYQKKILSSLYLANGRTGFEEIIKNAISLGVQDLDNNDLAKINFHRERISLQELEETELVAIKDGFDNALKEEKDIPVIVNNDGEVVMNKGDFIEGLNTKRKQVYPKEEFEKYRKTKNLKKLLHSLKEHFGTRFDDFSPEDVKNFIGGLVDQITGNGKEVRNDGQEEKGE